MQYELTPRQEPQQAHMCGIGGMVDRHPINPPVIVQFVSSNPPQVFKTPRLPVNYVPQDDHSSSWFMRLARSISRWILVQAQVHLKRGPISANPSKGAPVLARFQDSPTTPMTGLAALASSRVAWVYLHSDYGSPPLRPRLYSSRLVSPSILYGSKIPCGSSRVLQRAGFELEDLQLRQYYHTPALYSRLRFSLTVIFPVLQVLYIRKTLDDGSQLVSSQGRCGSSLRHPAPDFCSLPPRAGLALLCSIRKVVRARSNTYSMRHCAACETGHHTDASTVSPYFGPVSASRPRPHGHAQDDGDWGLAVVAL
ncbi:hypothetical protein C8J57DRAFT_1672570 [Mycena rebaudengoi]|nr:hypothetical protein C8J57DRAFT_1672570 [Mycena rebaudengoi]